MDENDNHSYWFVCPCETNIPPTYLPLSFVQPPSNYKLAFKSSSTLIFLLLLLFAHIWIPKKQKYVTNLIIIFQCGLDDPSMARKAFYSSQMKSSPPLPTTNCVGVNLCTMIVFFEIFGHKFFQKSKSWSSYMVLHLDTHWDIVSLNHWTHSQSIGWKIIS